MSPFQANDPVIAKLLWDSPIAIVVSTLADGHILEVNDSFVQLFGYTRDEVIGQTSVGLGLWVNPEQRAQLMAAVTAGQPLRDFEATVRTKSGAERQVLAAVTSAEIDRHACLLTQLYDVTADRQIETRFAALVEQLPVITYVHGLDAALTMTHISPQVETVLGYVPIQVLAGQPDFLTTRIYPEDQASVREAVERARVTGEPFRAEYRVRARDGRWVWLQDQAVLVRDPQGHPLLWQGVMADISERRRTEVARLAAEARYHALFAHSLDAVLLTAPNGRILDANSEACRLFGRTVEELRRVGRAGVVDLDDARLAAALSERGRAGHFRGELTMKRCDGASFPAEVAMQVFTESGGQAWTSEAIHDLTSQREAEAALRESDERFRAMVQNSYDVITMLHSDGTRRYVSPSIERLLGYSPDELLGRNLVDLVHPDDAPRLQEAIESFGRGVKETTVLELRFRHRDGSWRDFEAIGTNLLAEPGVAGIVFNSRDITRRKAAEAALRESEERFRSAFAHAATGMALIAEDGRFLQVNHSLCTILASSEGELLGTSFAEITLAEDRIVDGDLAQQLLRGEIASYQVEKRLVRKPDEVICGRITVSLVLGSAGEPLYFVAQIQDITPFKAAGAALRESEERFRRAFDHAPIGMSLVAQDGRFILVNRALCDMVGYSEEELLGKTFHDITHPEDVANNLELFERLWAGEIDAYQLEKRYLRKDGGVIWIHLTGSIVRDAEGPKNGIAQIVDITDRRHLEMDRAIMHASEREYTRQLRALTEMRADLTAMIAHELRAPVAALRMMTFLLATGELSSQDEGEMFAAVKGEIERLDRLINDVADVTSAEREDFPVHCHPVPLRALLENAAAFARTGLGNHAFAISEVPKLRVNCDPDRISQVLRNLLDNAAKHTPAGTSVELRAHRAGQEVCIAVTDNGPGLPAEDLPLIFEKFGRGRRAAAQQTPGAGLGLYLSRQIVQAHGSNLKVESAPGTGTVFAFSLEVAP